MTKKQIVEFNIGDIWPIALTFVITGLGVAYGLQAMGEAKTGMVTDNLGINCGQNATGGSTGIAYTNCGAAYNATDQAITGVAKFPEKFGTIITIVIAAIIIMILVRYLGNR